MQKKCEKMQKNFAMSKNCCTFAAAFEKRHYFFCGRSHRVDSIDTQIESKILYGKA
jgi:hypothetical protein